MKPHLKIITVLFTVSFTVFLVFLGIVIPSSAQPPLSELDRSCDPRLQQGLVKSLMALKLAKAAKRKNLSIALVDITDPSNPRHAFINPDEMMYAASLPKIAILLGAFERIKHGQMDLDPDTEEKLTKMIRNSCNQSATEMLNRVGKEYLADLLQSPQYRLYDPERNGGLWVGKEYSKSGAWRRDPIHNLSHGATVKQVARFYYMLAKGQLVSPKSSHQMKLMLAHPAINHKFVKGLKAKHPKSRIYRKSGTWRQYHADSAIVEHDGRRYIAVALAKSPKGGRWLSDLIVAMDKLIFETDSSLN